MNEAKIIESIASQTGINKKDVKKVLSSLEDVSLATLQNGEEINLTGFISINPRLRSARTGVDPRDPQKRIRMPQIVVPKFKAGKNLKDALKKTTPNN
ncbi:MAG: hypothetical protein COX77_00535 [Candidatus Komeilibacteria bacterium CG_4_10_14_0_2_um_filter_37_10]|uniref:DNA-binding protein n=1 Tax=Candidatus Komeilibacteria bacterium CG_4_10_14_0_2_um_filter_37_10 TaxID=1974470 RepID=A0A2M7VGC2_9BACT|nr:MAG: hypothetical protein COX77_00535 [Candidatus Komeilibacteria bacterium CG_4_10_14_0_2_um_filter_37_10]